MVHWLFLYIYSAVAFLTMEEKSGADITTHVFLLDTFNSNYILPSYAGFALSLIFGSYRC